MEYIIGANDKKRRNIVRRLSTVINTDDQGVQHTSSIAKNPHPVWSGNRYWNDQSLRTDQVLCDVELTPDQWVVQVIRKDRIHSAQG